ncbi:adenylate/guanylate cyclase domain-containing protein [Roseospirillum parvum]|uniref:adenylate/guanylate cyclase domain-containing protein n=1 Tax=Roseospirillum parvum TaxID=83401 RepID=UPI0015A09920|nr:adenylate/guanylate cyclase domain-containing protein [Roseospirillum parvum]
MAPSLDHVPLGWRITLHLVPLLAVAFLAFYGQVVCPFISGLPPARLLAGLLLAFAFQVVLRETLWRVHARPAPGQWIARHGWWLSVIGWGITGLVGMMLYYIAYPGYPWHTFFKLGSGYWALGAGILAQADYLVLEALFRRRAATGDAPRATPLERIAQRLMEGYALFTVVPGVVMVLMAWRFHFDGLTSLRVALEVLFLALVFAVAALLVAGLYGRALKRDCANLLGGLSEVGAGRFDLRLDTSRPDELGQVAAGLNRMAAGLAQRERIREAFGRFVNPEVAAAFLAREGTAEGALSQGGERREVAVLMADIRGFTALSESLEPEVLTGLLNGCFAELVAAVQAHEGMVDKFIGDGMMAVFGLAGRSCLATCAVEAALEIDSRMAAFNARGAALGRPALTLGLGLHKGPVVAGYMGAPERLEFTVTGLTVNVAARLQDAARAPRPGLLMSRQLADALPPEIPTRPVASLDLPGLTRPVEAYTTATTSALPTRGPAG